MLQPLIRVSGLIFVLCSLLIAFVHSQSYDAEYFASVRLIIEQPIDCDSAACLMGIYPARTSPRAALQIIQTHDWVSEIVDLRGLGELAGDTGDSTQFARWRWSGQQPLFFQGRAIFTGNFQEDTVEYIELDTNITLGTWLHVFGKPRKLTHLTRSEQLLLDYADGLQISASVQCPTLWDARVSLLMYQQRWNSNASEPIEPIYAQAC